jgi:hypothetical protein
MTLPPWQWTKERSFHLERYWTGEVLACYIDWTAPDGVGLRHSIYLTTLGLDGTDEDFSGALGIATDQG